MKLTYRRTLSAARKIGEAFRRATTPFQNKEGLLERLLAIDPEDIPEGDDGNHATGYVGAVLEFAAQHSSATGCGPDDENHELRQNPREFAQHFLSKRPEYSKTSAGRSASMLEAWLMERSGYLFARFVETVIEGKEGNKFLTIFEGKLNPEEMKKLRSGTGGFMRYDTLIEAGTSNGEEIFEFTILDCTAQTVQKSEEPEMEKPGRPDKDDIKPQGDMAQAGNRFESLLPSSRDEYDSVFEQGGVSSEALEVIAGADIFDTVVERDGHRVVRDENGVDWIEDDGAWKPDVDAIEESADYSEYPKPSQMPRNYRQADAGDACGSCRYFRYKGEGRYDEGGYCHLFAYEVERAMTCDSWEAQQEGMAHTSIGESEADERRALRSDYGSWVFVDEGEHTVVVVGEQAWMVPHAFDEVAETVAAVGELYGGLPDEGDLVAEATLRDFARECGVPCALPSDRDELIGESRIEERDTIVEENNAKRLEEAEATPSSPVVESWARELGVELSEAERLWTEADTHVSESYADVEPGSERWHQLRIGSFRTSMRQLSERQKTTPALAFQSEEPSARQGAAKVSGLALRLWQKEVPGFKVQDAMFKQVRAAVAAVPRTDLPKFFGVNASGASAIPDAQDVVAKQPRKAFQLFLRKLQMVSPKLHGYLQKRPEFSSIIFHIVVTRLSGEDMANLIFKRYFSTESDHPGAAMKRPSESLDEWEEWATQSLPLETDLTLLLEKDDDEGGGGKKA